MKSGTPVATVLHLNCVAKVSTDGHCDAEVLASGGLAAANADFVGEGDGSAPAYIKQLLFFYLRVGEGSRRRTRKKLLRAKQYPFSLARSFGGESQHQLEQAEITREIPKGLN